MNENPKHTTHIHRCRSIRLKGYDYSQAGLYFITICCQNRTCMFGNIENGKMILNDAGKMALKCWNEIPEHFKHAQLHEYVIMPNHIHGIIELSDIIPVGAKNFSPLQMPQQSPLQMPQQSPQPIIPSSPSKTIGSIVRGFKIGVTTWMRQNTDIYNVWQRNYYEHIIRNEKSYVRIAEYIINNPAKWTLDK
ncbi:MAG: transposase [Bacteroidales bacterium]